MLSVAVNSCLIPYNFCCVQHNNTTPDDIGICEAYLAFLRGNGDNGAYWKVLDSHGATTNTRGSD